MIMKKYKLGEIAKICNGATPSTKETDNYDGNIVWATPKELSDQKSKYFYYGERNITKKGFDSCSTQMIPANNILMSSRAPIGLFAINKVDCCTNQGFKNIILDKSISDVDFMYYFLKYHVKEIESLGSGTTFKEVSKASFEKYEISIPPLETQQKIAAVLSSLDDKIAMNRRINAKLEQMAKRLYDHWFVQFDFPFDFAQGKPNADGKPYKSSGGKMVWNEVLKIEIPEGWGVKKIYSLIKENIGGDWGKEELTGNYQLKVSCCRGADIVSMTDLPTRYILNSNSSKLLEENDMVVEISGGSPTQSTGRCVLISKEILSSFDNKLICSNFCQALSISDKNYVSYFYHMWKMFYDNDIFFNFEGKTSGIKNFQYDTFVAEKWYFPPKELAKQFGEIASKNYKMKCALDKENKQLTTLRDRLLPLLMNGQVEVR